MEIPSLYTSIFLLASCMQFNAVCKRERRRERERGVGGEIPALKCNNFLQGNIPNGCPVKANKCTVNVFIVASVKNKLTENFVSSFSWSSFFSMLVLCLKWMNADGHLLVQ